MKSDVYFVKTAGNDLEKRLNALKRLLDKTDSFFDYEKKELVPVKITIGDLASVHHVNPVFVKCVLDRVKNKGASPFLFDTNVIYKGERQNAADHLNLAEKKGFGHSNTGSPFIVADGLLGQDGKTHKLKGRHIKEARVPSFIGFVESLILITHATGHIVSGYAGAIKNVAMGMSCRPTKQVQHSSIKPNVFEAKCTLCGCCAAICPVGAIRLGKKSAFINHEACVGCGECICACKFDAISVSYKEDPLVFSMRMVEVARFVLSGFKKKFFITFALDITKECDCLSDKNDAMISDDLGILASGDIVSLDRATVDMALRHKKGSFLKDKEYIYEEMLAYASKCGMGKTGYNLIEV